jgi:hypothetical protein
MRAACSFLRQHSRRRDCGVTIFEFFQNFFTTPDADLQQALRIGSAAVLIIDFLTRRRCRNCRRIRSILQRSVTMTTSLSKSELSKFEFRSLDAHRSYDGLIILSYAVFSILALGAIYFAAPGTPADASLAIAMALP